jgi:hypothetical protein
MKLFVKTLAGSVVALEVSSTDTLESVKKRVEEQNGIPVCQQRIIFNRQALEDDSRSLADLNIPDETTLCLLLSCDHHRRRRQQPEQQDTPVSKVRGIPGILKCFRRK